MTQHQTSDAERVTDIYQRYAPDIAAYVMRRISGADAADAVAETFLVAWRRCQAIPDEPNTLPWLYGVARRVLANQRRGNLRRSLLGDRLADRFATLDHNADSSGFDGIDEVRRIGKAIGRLPDDDAELLRLTAWEALSPTEIATSMGIAPGTARQRLHRARQRLRKELAADSCSALSNGEGAHHER